jgi:hypothetical protein
MTQRKFRDVTEADIGKRIEVTDDWSISRGIVWHKRTLEKNFCASYPFMADNGGVWKHARIEVKDDPA